MIDDDAVDAAGLLGGLAEDRAAQRLEPGDGRPLEPFRWWHLVSGRKLFGLAVPRVSGPDLIYAVDVRLSGRQAGDDGGKAHLYRDGVHAAASNLPAVFPVEGGVIQVAVSAYGLKRIHYVAHRGGVRQLTPHPQSAIGRRLRLERGHPALSRGIAGASVVVLVIGVALNAPQLLQVITEIPPVAERFGTFVSPLQLPLWLNITTGAAAALASVERGLRLRYHWLLDGLGN